MIIFTSDHGEMLGENNLWGKLGWWDSSYRIPLIIHVPGQQPHLIDEMTESVFNNLISLSSFSLQSLINFFIPVNR